MRTNYTSVNTKVINNRRSPVHQFYSKSVRILKKQKNKQKKKKKKKKKGIPKEQVYPWILIYQAASQGYFTLRS